MIMVRSAPAFGLRVPAPQAQTLDSGLSRQRTGTYQEDAAKSMLVSRVAN
jgi:hypothetical protein